MTHRIKALFNPKTSWYYPLSWVILIALTLIIYGQVLGAGFVFDDDQFIVQNPYIRNWAFFYKLWDILPLTRLIGMASFAFNYQWHQLDPFGYHLFNCFIHLLAAGLVWSITTKLTVLSRKAWPAMFPFAVAVLFLVHPGQTQAVSYISQRFESMAALFYFASVHCYLNARMSRRQNQTVLMFSLSALAACLGILTKETVITLPLVLLLIEWIFFNERKNKFQFIFLIGVGLALSLILLKFVKGGLALWSAEFVSESHEGDILNAGNYCLTQARVFLTFLKVLVYPLYQNVDYDFPASVNLWTPLTTIVGMMAAGFLATAVVLLRRSNPLAAFGFGWVLITFAVNLVPRSNVIFEHKLYLISFGFCLSVAAIVTAWCADKRARVLILIIVVLSLTGIAWARNHVWQNELSLWSDAVRKSPEKERPYVHLIKLNDPAEIKSVLMLLNRLIEENPKRYHALTARGAVKLKLKAVDEALLDFNRAIALNHQGYVAYYKRAMALRRLGRDEEALLDLKKALQLKPDFKLAYIDRGLMLAKAGRLELALEDMNQALMLAPYDVEALINRAGVLFMLARYESALTDLNQALRQDPQRPEVYKNIGLCLMKLGRQEQARQYLELVDHGR